MRTQSWAEALPQTQSAGGLLRNGWQKRPQPCSAIITAERHGDDGVAGSALPASYPRPWVLLGRILREIQAENSVHRGGVRHALLAERQFVEHQVVLLVDTGEVGKADGVGQFVSHDGQQVVSSLRV